MISIEIRINGTLITAVNAVNKRTVKSDYSVKPPIVICEYEFQGVRFPVDGSLPIATHGRIEHGREDGAEILVSKLMKAIVETNKG
jgi:hypothetical protein